MPRFLAAILCGTLIVTYPKMLDIALGHTEKLEMPWVVYGVLPGTTALFCGLIAWYMWLGYNAKPSGFDDLLRSFRKVFGEDKKDDGEAKPNDLEKVTEEHVRH